MDKYPDKFTTSIFNKQRHDPREHSQWGQMGSKYTTCVYTGKNKLQVGGKLLNWNI